MKATISNLTLTNQNIVTAQNNQNFKGTDKDANPKMGLPWKRYCWLCGCCVHWSRACPNKNRGHKDEAAFKTRMNGSNDN